MGVGEVRGGQLAECGPAVPGCGGGGAAHVPGIGVITSVSWHEMLASGNASGIGVAS